MPELPLIGDEFAGYRLRSIIGRGGMSTVYQAENPRLGNVIALKVLAPELAGDDVFRTRFLEESRIAAAMNHPHVIPIHDMGSSDGLLYIAMRCVMGTDLRLMVKKRGRLPAETAIALLSQAARALDAAHGRGLVHRDVKPGNLLVERGNDDSDPDHVYLADFGITKPVIGRSGLTASGEFLGTVDYVAPEQIRGGTVAGTADQYSLGCVLYECLTGRVPFEKDLDAAIIWAHVEERPTPPTEFRPDLPPAVDTVFARVLAKQPDDRYENCRALMAAAGDALRMVTAGRPAGGSPAGGSPRVPLSAPPLDLPPMPLPPMERLPQPEWAAPYLEDAASYQGDAASLGDSPPDEAGPPDYDAGSGWPSRRGRRVPALLVAIALVVAVGIGVGIGKLTGSSSPAPAPAAASAPAGPSAGASPGMAGLASPTASLASPTASLAPPGLAAASTKSLRQALAAVNVTIWTTGYLPPKTCTFISAGYARCGDPFPGITEAVFQDYSSPAALYRAYATAIKQANNGHVVLNTQDCGSSAPPASGAEVSWNHEGLHTQSYSVRQLESGKLNAASQAAGRMFCKYDSSTNTEDIIWTQTDGNMLGEVTGAPHLEVWAWWLHVHHNIAFNGQPMGAMDTSAPDPFPKA